MARKRILVVDDEPQVLSLLASVLSAEGYIVDGAPDAASALAQVRGQIYDGAILDFNLPDLDGVQLHREIRQVDPELANRTLFASGFVQSDGRLEYYATEGSGFVAKPFDPQQVITAVEQLVGPSDAE
jgi:two-component system chemotaxis response regulator CheY